MFEFDGAGTRSAAWLAEARRVVARPVEAERFSDPDTIKTTRHLARELCRLLGGSTWQAFSVERRHGNHAEVEAAYQQVVMIDDDRLIVVTHVRPARSDRDRWSITLNGIDVAHRASVGVRPWATEAIVYSVTRHVQLSPLAPCDSLGCPAAPVFATYGGAFCPAHIDR